MRSILWRKNNAEYVLLYLQKSFDKPVVSKNIKQEVFNFMRAQFDVLKHEVGKYIFIRDIGQVCRSVTNDAEYAV